MLLKQKIKKDLEKCESTACSLSGPQTWSRCQLLPGSMQTDLVQFESMILKCTGKVKEMAKTILNESTRGEETSLYNSKHGGSHD